MKRPFFFKPHVSKKAQGFTLVELLIVMGVIALVYSVALPRMSAKGSLAFDSLTKLSNDVRSAFDTTVLTGKTHRLVFEVKSGKYWLEVTDDEKVYLGEQTGTPDLDPSALEEKKEEFERRFENFKDLAGEPVKDPEDDSEILPPSPVLKAKKKLEPPQWRKVQTLEWSERQLDEILVINDVKTQHHEEAVSFENISSDEDFHVTVLILPSGYIEQTLFHIYYRKGDGSPDFDQKPFTVLIHPTLGIATYVRGLKEINEDGGLDESEFL